jgi:hypothetical protein
MCMCMPEINESGRLVHIRLSESDFRKLEGNETVTVECPHTGETIAFDTTRGKGLSADNTEVCECCGQTIEYEITPSIAFDVIENLKNGGTSIYSSVHTEDDITIIVRADWDVCGGWQ